MSAPLPHCPSDLEKWDLRLMIAFVDGQLPGWQWLIRSHHVNDKPAGYFADMIPPRLSMGRNERFPVYAPTPEEALSTSIRCALNMWRATEDTVWPVRTN
jgi:hypothetical protein